MNGFEMDWKVFGVVTFTVVATYLILALPFSGATEVNIYFNNVRQGSPAIINPSRYIELEITSEFPFNSVHVSISGDYLTSVDIFKCKSKNPEQCVETVSKQHFDENVSVDYSLSGVVDTGISPQIGYLLIIVNILDSNGEKRIGYWTKLKKTQSQFTSNNYWINSVDIHTDDITRTQDIRDFINNRQTIPFNWINRMVLNDVDRYYKVDTDNFVDFDATHSDTDEIVLLGSTHSMVFGESGNVYGPIFLYNNPDSFCGNNNCDDGEDSTKCCWDCPCIGDYYCSSPSPLEGSYCRPLSSIRLKYVGAVPGTSIENCNEAQEIEIYVKIDNKPPGTTVLSSSYRLGDFRSTPVCTEEGERYKCIVTVPADPDCEQGVTTIGPNSMTFRIQFPDGPESRDKKELELTTSLPTITVSSWTCGQDGCESQLGETCCYDCGCEAGVCDYAEWMGYEEAECKSEVTDSDLYFTAISSSNFYSYTDNNNVEFELNVRTGLQSFSSIREDCRIGCEFIPDEGDRGSCTSSCSLRCEEEDSVSDSVKNFSCSMGFTIDYHNERYSYELTPNIDMDFSYSDGSESKTGHIQRDMNKITLGPNWCGNGDCAGGETYSDCCYDCPCEGDNYCYFTDSVQECRGIDQISINVRNSGDSEFDGTMSHIVNYSLTIQNQPSDFEIVSSCEYNGTVGEMYCMIDCYELESNSNQYQGYCEIRVPPLDYRNTPFYNDARQQIIITPVDINIILNYKDGARDSEMKESFRVAPIVVNVLANCGDGWCSDDLGENARNCCRDCFCEASDDFGNEYFCKYEPRLSGIQDPGECIEEGEVKWIIDNIDEIHCEIDRLDTGCEHMRTVKMYTHVENVPPNSYIDSEYPLFYYINGNQTYDITCVKDFETPENLNCSIILPEVGDFEVGSKTMQLDFNAVLSFLSGITIKRVPIEASSEVVINMNKSATLLHLEHKYRKLDRKTERLETIKLVLEIILAVLIATEIALLIACGFGCGWCCGVASGIGKIIVCISTILLAIIMPLLAQKITEYKQEMKQLQAEMGTGKQEKIQQDIIATIVIPVMGAIVTALCPLIKGPKGGEVPVNARPIQTPQKEMINSIGKPIEMQWLESGSYSPVPESPLLIDRAYP